MPSTKCIRGMPLGGIGGTLGGAWVSLAQSPLRVAGERPENPFGPSAASAAQFYAMGSLDFEGMPWSDLWLRSLRVVLCRVECLLS